MSYMELGRSGLYQHVVYIYFHGCPYLPLEHPVHQSLVGSSCIFQSEGHYPVAIGPSPYDEGGLLLIAGIHADLVVTGESIHRAEEFMAGCGVYYKVDPR